MRARACFIDACLSDLIRGGFCDPRKHAPRIRRDLGKLVDSFIKKDDFFHLLISSELLSSEGELPVTFLLNHDPDPTHQLHAEQLIARTVMQQATSHPIFIGITMLCCPACCHVLSEISPISFRGTHGVTFPSNALAPDGSIKPFMHLKKTPLVADSLCARDSDSECEHEMLSLPQAAPSCRPALTDTATAAPSSEIKPKLTFFSRKTAEEGSMLKEKPRV